MAVVKEQSSSGMRTPEKRPSRVTTDTGTRRTIGRSRRRRPISTPSKAVALIDELDGKENHRDNQLRRKTSTKTNSGANTPMRSRGETNRNYIYAESSVQQRGGKNSGETTRICEVASRDFKKALLRISVPLSLWSDFPKLAQTVVHISITSSTTIDSLGLDEHAPSLLVLSRKLIKEASLEASGKSEPKSQKKNLSVKDNLFVAVHILRSIAFALSDEATVERKEALLKMFFHLISSSRKNEECYKSITLAGYEGLTKVLSTYSIKQCRGDGKEQLISFKPIHKDNDSSYDLNQRILFAVPSTARRKMTDLKAGSMTTRQLSTIAFQTTIAVAKTVLALEDDQLLSYENLGLTVCGNFDCIKESTITPWHRIALDLLHQVHGPWLMMLAKTSTQEREVAKEAISYSKGIHRLLWDAASARKLPLASSSKTSRKIEMDCLELRKRAILHLLTSTGNSKLDLLIRKTSLESGCLYAWKAASVFVQQMSSESDRDKSVLCRYYEDTDAAFADLNNSNPHIPMGFVEYSIHRSLHLESISSLCDKTCDFDQIDIREDEILNGNYRILLHLLNYGMRSKIRIQDYLNGIESSSSRTIRTPNSVDSMPEDLEKIIHEFNWQVVHRMDEIHSDSMNRILKALCNLSLHKTLFLTMKVANSNNSSSNRIFDELERELLVIATILAECVGPLVSAYLNLNPQKVTQLADLMMECFLRPLSLYEQLLMIDGHEDQRYLDASLNVSKYITEILIDDSMRPDDFVLPVQCIEKAAKSIYTLARKRNDDSRIEDSIPPLICSVKLYNKLDSHNGLKKDYQLSSRLFMLSSALQSMEMVEECFFIRCLIIDYESEKNCVDLTESSIEEILLSHFESMCGGFLPVTTYDAPVLPQMIRSMCRQMAIDLINSEISTSDSEVPHCFDDFSVDSTISLLFEQFSNETDNVRAPTCLKSIEKLLGFDRIVKPGTRLMHIFALTEIIVQFGISLQQLSQDLEISETQLRVILHSYSRLQGLLQCAISNLGLQCCDVFEGLLGLISSTSIVPSFSIAGNIVSPDWEKGMPLIVLELATDTANSSVEKLEQALCSGTNCEDDLSWNLLCESLGIAVRHLIALLQRKATGKNSDDAIFDDCISVVERLFEFQEKERKRSVLLRSYYWTIWITAYLRNELENRGDHDRAASFSLWELSLAEKIQPDQPWFRAVAMTTFSRDGSLLHLNESLSNYTHDENVTKGSANWIFETELRLCELRVAAPRSFDRGGNDLHFLMQHVLDILAELEEFAIAKSSKLYVLYSWALSTAYLVQTDIASRFGCYGVALKSSQMCQKCCQSILRRASSGIINSHEWMTAIATSTVLQLAAQRYIEMFSRRPKFYYRMGDHRKALAYTRSVLEYLNIDPNQVILKEGEGYLREDIKNLLEATSQSRLFLQMTSWSSNPETAMQQFSDIQPCDFRRQDLNDSSRSSSVIDSIQDMITVGDILYGESVSKRFQQQYSSFFDEAVVLMSQRTHHLRMESQRLPPGMEQRLGMPIVDQVKLRDIRRLRSSNSDSEVSILRLCSEIEESESVLHEDKGWAFYYLGLLDIEAARRTGALDDLWNDNGIPPTPSLVNDENIRSARFHLKQALLYSSEASDVFQRNVLRSLALVKGPDIQNEAGCSAGVLVLKSIGQSLRRKLKYAFDKNHTPPKDKNLNEIFGVFDAAIKSEEDKDNKIQSFFDNLASQTPDEWTFVATAICPSGEILASVLQKEDSNPNKISISTKCLFPSRGRNAYDDIMTPLDSILARVQQHLDGVDPSFPAKINDKEAIKRRWWDQRNQLDAEMCDLLEDVESLYFSKIFDFQLNDNGLRSNMDEFPCGNLASQFEEAVSDTSIERTCEDQTQHQEKVDILMKLTVPKLKDRLLSSGAEKSQFRKLRKADLIELLIQIEKENTTVNDEAASSAKDVNRSNASQSCLFLILDENLHRFPFEGMPILKGKTVCRIPCLSFVLATLHETGPKQCPSINPFTTSYILNPENNLQATQDRLLPEIQKISSSRGWNWDGVIGDIPPSSFYSEALHKKDGLMMYFGHGGAQVCFSRRKVDDLIEQRGVDVCRSTILLMGCSSGKLISINRKHFNSIEETPLYYEPEGVALSYLCAGAPCVIGNLWDVTDNDIDRFSISLMEDFFGSNAQDRSLAQSLSISRSVCKMKHLVGCAPVCYGIPVYLRPS